MVTHGEDGTVSAHNIDLPTTGYYVGGKYPSLTFDYPHLVDRGEIAWWIGNNPSPWYGVWVDSDDGKVYIDAVNHVDSQRVALSLGRIRQEIAVWDIENGKEIRVDASPAGD
jgi:hypothetical protein